MSDQKKMAIVRVDESWAVTPAKNKKQPPLVERRYVEFTPPLEPYQSGRTPPAKVVATREDDLSMSTIDDVIDNAYEKYFLTPVILSFVFFAFTGPLHSTISLVSLLCCFASVLSAISLRDRFGQFMRNRILCGRPDEGQQISQGLIDLELAAEGMDVFPDCNLRVPIESLFFGFRHENPLVRQLALDLITDLPDDVKLRTLKHFYGVLSAEQIGLVCGQPLPALCAQAHDDRNMQGVSRKIAIDYKSE